MLVEEGEAAEAHSVHYTGRKAKGQSEPGLGFEAEERTAPSGCGRASSEAEAWESGEGRILGNEPETRAVALDEAWLVSEESAWVL